jgi:hypothetical protein
MSGVIATDMIGQRVFVGEFAEKKAEEKYLVIIRVIYYGSRGLCVAVEDKEGNLNHDISFSSIKLPKLLKD